MVSEILGFLLNKGGGAWSQGVIWLRGGDLKSYMVKGWGSEEFLRY